MRPDADGRPTEECQRLVVQSMILIDRRRYDELVALFTDDAVWVRSDRTCRGKAEIRSALDSRPAGLVTRHLVTNILVDVAGSDAASAISYFLAYTHDGGPAAPAFPIPCSGPNIAGELADEFVRAPAGWRILTRRTDRVFVRS